MYYYIAGWKIPATPCPGQAAPPPGAFDQLERATLAQMVAAAGEENERLRQANVVLRGQVTQLERDLATAREGAKELRAELARRDARDARNAQAKAASTDPAPAPPAPPAPPRFTLLEIDLPEETPAPKEGS